MYNVKGMISKLGLMKELVAVFALISFIVLALGAALCYKSMVNVLKQKSQKTSLNQLSQVEYNIDSLLEEIDKTSKLVLVDPAIQELLNNKDPSVSNRIDLYNNIIQKFTNVLMNYENISSIFIFSESGECAGYNRLYSFTNFNENRKTNFYKTRMYKESIENFPEIIWGGAISLKDIWSLYGNDLKVDMNTPSLITATRAIKGIYNTEISGALVININQEVLAESYSRLIDREKNKFYIVDDSGTIISSVDPSMLGHKSRNYQYINHELSQGSITINNKGVGTQIVYQKISLNNWMLIQEISIPEYTKEALKVQQIIFIVFLLNLLFIIIISTIFIRKITQPINSLVFGMKNVGKGNLGFTVEEDYGNEIGILSRQFNKMSKNIADLVKEKEEIEKEKISHEVAALQAQINPHFLFNTINIIKWMAIMSKAVNVADSLTTLGNLLQPIYKNPSLYFTIEEEIAYLNNYIKIMNYRYAGIIKLCISMDESIKKYKIVRFIIQPILENTIIHGLNPDSSSLNIDINITANCKELTIEIRDNGQGIEENTLKQLMLQIEMPHKYNNDNRYGIGLCNINQRIKLNYGTQYGLNISNLHVGGALVIIKVPIFE